jgi:ketosteroid isomerase-like protein
MKRASIISCLMFLLVSPLFADCSAGDKKALESFDRAWGEAATAGDRAALEKVYASDYMGMTPGNTLNRADTIDTAVRDAQRASASGVAQPVTTHDYYIINCSANAATITHRNVITANEDGHSRTDYTRSVHFLEKRNGSWQVVSNAGNPLGDGAQVAYLEHEWNDAEVNGDSEWFERNYTSDLTSIAGRTGKMTGKAEEIADMKTSKDKMTSAELSELDTRTAGDAIVATGINRVRGTDGDGKAFDRRIAFTDVWVKRDGRWQIMATQGTDMK